MEKLTLVQALRSCTGRTVHRESRGIALPFHDHGIRRGWGVSVTPRSLFNPGKVPVPIVQEAGWAPGPVWTGAENLAPSRIWSPNRPARTQSLYRLSYLGQKILNVWDKICRENWNITFTLINPYPTAFPYGNGMVLHSCQQQESSTTKTVHKVINKRLKTYL